MVSLGKGDQIGSHFILSNHLLAGIMWSLLGAFCYAVYLVFLQKSVGAAGKLDVPMFFGESLRGTTRDRKPHLVFTCWAVLERAVYDSQRLKL